MKEVKLTGGREDNRGNTLRFGIMIDCCVSFTKGLKRTSVRKVL